MVAAWNAAGEREAAFSDAGVLEPASLAGLGDENFEGVTAIVRRSDGSIVVAGNAPPKSTTGFLAALSPQGALLPGFGVDGVVRAPEAKPALLELAGLLPLPRGKVLGLGSVNLGPTDEAPVLVRYTAANRLDRTFGRGKGYVLPGAKKGRSLSGPTGFATDRGRILTSVFDYPRDRLLMVQAKNGSPVASFGSGGFVDLPGGVSATALAFGHGGRPVVLGRRHHAGPPANEPGVVFRYLPGGEPDRSFRRGDGFTMRLGKRAVQGSAILAGPGRRILAGGNLGDRFAIVSLLPDGRPDPRFGRHGWAVVDTGLHTEYMTLGRVGSYLYLAGAVAKDSGHREVVLMRFDRRGHLDKTFGRHGLLTAPLVSRTQPIQIVPVGRSVLLVLSGGHRPLLTVTARGRIRRPKLGGKRHYLDDLRTGIGDGALVIGWNEYAGEGRAYGHLSRRPLPGS